MYFTAGKEHKDKIHAGMRCMPANFNARICGACDGEGQYEQMYTNGCGMGYSNWMGKCEFCKGLGLMQGRKPAAESVVNQVIEAGPKTPMEWAEYLYGKLQCNCDLDNWEPEKETGHSHVCRIHKAAMRKFEGA